MTLLNTACLKVSVVSFIPTRLAEFYDKHEEDIEDILDGCDIRLHDLVDDQEFYTIQELKEKSVWFVVEDYCQSRVNALYD